MINKGTIIITLTGIGCLILNFNHFLMGSPATILNLIATLAYITIWIFVLINSVKIKNGKALIVYTIFWILTLFFSIHMGYVNVTEVHADWAIPYVILLITPWYGIRIFVDSFVIVSIIIASFSAVMLTVIAVSFVKMKKVQTN